MIGIYSITNKLNNKRYIGQSIDIETRIKRHFRELRRGVHHCHHLQRAFDKYGEDNFETEILLICNENDDLNEKEKEYIEKYDSYRNGYNLTMGGKGDSGLIVTDEFRAKMSKLVRGEKNPNYGNKWAQEMKNHLSEKFSDGSRKGENNKRAKKIIRVEDCRVYEYIDKAAKEIGLKNGASITRCLNNRSFIAGGYHFVLYSDEMFNLLSNEDKKFEYLCECYKENASSVTIADMKNKIFYSKHDFIKMINRELHITTREISNILKNEKIIEFGNNIYQLLVA